MTASEHIWVLNAGSSSLKAETFVIDAAPRSLGRLIVEGIGGGRPASLRAAGGDVERLGVIRTHAEAAHAVLDRLGAAGGARASPRVAATGHRIVHGGSAFTRPVPVDAAVRVALGSLGALAPLHNPPALAVLDAVAERLPDVPAVAVFDTAFFRTLPEHARRYAVPQAWQREHGIERFGFHGLAHEWMARRLAAAGAPQRAVSLQLGHGCSAAALLAGRPLDTSMGYTPLAGLVMATRPGDLDPGVLLALGRRGHDWAALEQSLHRESGLRGLSGASGDVRELLALEAGGHDGATLALAVFCGRVRQYIGAYAAVLGGLDAIAFGGGIGENSAELRARICAGFEWLGLELDREANAAAVGRDARISSPHSAIAVHVVEVREEALIADAVLACVGSERPTNERSKERR